MAAAEFPQVWPIFREIIAAGDSYAFDSAMTVDQAQRLWTTPPTRPFVAIHEGRTVGTYMLRPVQPGRGNHIANAAFMVASAARGHGIARQMCEHSLEVARKAGFKAMQFSFVVASNQGAIRLWEKCGFRVVGRVPAAFQHKADGLVDALIMHRAL
jgi:ribosomal protein S18 acetylase RimI-like enzyme